MLIVMTMVMMMRLEKIRRQKQKDQRGARMVVNSAMDWGKEMNMKRRIREGEKAMEKEKERERGKARRVQQSNAQNVMWMRPEKKMNQCRLGVTIL